MRELGADRWCVVNEAIRPKFLDLKEGAYVVSLKPFVSNTRLTERNVSALPPPPFPSFSS